jgi:hypothetical protein
MHCAVLLQAGRTYHCACTISVHWNSCSHENVVAQRSRTKRLQAGEPSYSQHVGYERRNTKRCAYNRLTETREWEILVIDINLTTASPNGQRSDVEGGYVARFDGIALSTT